MKKYIAGVLIATLFIAGGVGAFLIFTNQDKVNAPITAENSSAGMASATIDACTILTNDIVKDFVGKEVQKVAAPASDIGTTGRKMSTCNYIAQLTENIETEGPKLSGANLIIYTAHSANAVQDNKAQFSQKPENITEVEGIGDDAYYNPDYRQLHVMKGSSWYVLTAYKDSILNSTLESTKELAEKMAFK